MLTCHHPIEYELDSERCLNRGKFSWPFQLIELIRIVYDDPWISDILSQL